MIQLAIVSRLPLLHGTADIVLLAIIAWALQEKVKTAWIWSVIAGLMVSMVSGLPYYIPLIAYLTATAVARMIQRRVWQVPLLSLFVTIVVGTLFYHGLTILILIFTGTPLPLQDSLTLITLPSLLLNILLALPIYTLIKDLANWFYPVDLE